MLKNKMIKLNKENYYSAETDWQYMSVSVFKAFMDCEAATLDKLTNNTLADEDAKPLLVGNYVHSYFESPAAHQEFLDQHGTKMLTKAGNLYSDYKVADKMIARLEADDFFNWLYQGEKESIVTGELFGTEWKGKIDCLNIKQGYFVDLKTTANLNLKVWSDKYGGRVLWPEAYGYVLQMSVYKHLLEQQYGKQFDPYIFAVSKTDPAGIKCINLSKELGRFAFEDAYVKKRLPHVLAVMNGEVKPKRCGKCDWCHEHQLGQYLVTLDQLANE
ncbi:PD-(D/E)XK nuclease-like domain-containing protein [Lactiplantibacillus plantarum]|uniref:PD-(D/E)XK nuclease-like domain-containing protein n=1 Tax=Lactiplantibacillus plantarum TaxID=1590 RepID=UPI00097646DB|nr:PD-(D/E)XK nuclease-like domain-containing protein [Lactiplantibacillus plantarum]